MIQLHLPEASIVPSGEKRQNQTWSQCCVRVCVLVVGKLSLQHRPKVTAKLTGMWQQRVGKLGLWSSAPKLAVKHTYVVLKEMDARLIYYPFLLGLVVRGSFSQCVLNMHRALLKQQMLKHWHMLKLFNICQRLNICGFNRLEPLRVFRSWAKHSGQWAIIPLSYAIRHQLISTSSIGYNS